VQSLTGGVKIYTGGTGGIDAGCPQYYNDVEMAIFIFILYGNH
jgi:hypothetical protein